MAKSKVLVLVGTRKGGFIFSSDAKRKSWGVMHMQMDPRDRRIHAAADHFVYGSTTHYSDDLGRSWTQAARVPALPRPSKSGRPPSSPHRPIDAAHSPAPMPASNTVWG